MKIRYIGAVLVITGFAGGCATQFSEAPLATNFPTTTQQKARAAAHWNVIAKDAATQITVGLTDKRPLYVKQSATRTGFERAFSNQLISALVEQGRTVSKTPTGALLVEVDTQSVQFSRNRPQYRYAGAATVLGAGVWALHAADATVGAVVMAGAVSYDAYSWFKSEFASGATPQMEIILTTSIGDDSRYIARSTSVYYIADADRSLYETVPVVRVTGGI